MRKAVTRCISSVTQSIPRLSTGRASIAASRRSRVRGIYGAVHAPGSRVSCWVVPVSCCSERGESVRTSKTRVSSRDPAASAVNASTVNTHRAQLCWAVNFCAALRHRRLRRRAARSGARPPRGCERLAAQRCSPSARTECTWAATRHLSCATQQVCLAQLAPSVTVAGAGPRVCTAPLCRASPAARALK